MRGTSVRIRYTDFPTHRRRRRRDQNSTCCCLGMVVACALIALVAGRKPLFRALGELFAREATQPASRPMFPIEISVPQQDWYRYSRVPVKVRFVAADGTPISSSAPEVVVLDRAGEIVETVGRLRMVPLRFDASEGVWVGAWPVPYGAEAGPDAVYTFEAKAIFSPEEWEWEPPETRRERARQEEGAQEQKTKSKSSVAGSPTSSSTTPAICTANASFRVLRRERLALSPGTCAVTWEPDFPEGQLVRPNGTKGDWRGMFDWAEFMGADALWFRGAVTEVYSRHRRLTLDNPWNVHNLGMIPEMAEEARRRGIRFGVWAVALETYPNKPGEHALMKQFKPAYRWTEDFSRSRRVPTEEAAISLLDKERPKHLADFLSRMQATEGVDYVGFDYIRSGADWGGYELSSHFAQEMAVYGLPTTWRQWSREELMGWLCDRVDGNRWASNKDLYHQWNWYRTHLLCNLISSMVQQSGLRKPLWAFTLSWWHGEQHGQDPLMFADAGVSICAVMLYECDSVAQFEAVIEQWREGIDEEGGIPAGHTNIMVGDQVSFNSHQRLTNPAAPEELYRRITKAASQLTKGGPAWGAFVHDISRLCAPKLAANRGPYSGREWALAGAAAFSTVRANWGVQPVRCQLAAPRSAPVGDTITCELSIENHTEVSIPNLTINVLDTAGINRITKAERVAKLGPKQKVTVPIQVQLTKWDPTRASRFMIAARVFWPPGRYGKRVRSDLPRHYTAIAYVTAR